MRTSKERTEDDIEAEASVLKEPILVTGRFNSTPMIGVAHVRHTQHTQTDT